MRKALLLAAGLGSRLAPLTNYWPKCLMPIAGIPLLEIWLRRLKSANFAKVLVNVHYLSDEVLQFLNRKVFKGFVEYVYEESLLGTAGTLRSNAAFFRGHAFLVAHADNYSELDIGSFWGSHFLSSCRPEVSLASFRTASPQDCGIIRQDRNNNVRELFEKNSLGEKGFLANGAIYIFEPSVLEKILVERDWLGISEDVLPAYLGRIRNQVTIKHHIDIGTPEKLMEAQSFSVGLDLIPDEWTAMFRSTVLPKIKNDLKPQPQS